MLREYLNLPRQVHVLCLGMLLNRAGSFFVVFLTIYLREQLGFSVRFATLAIAALGLGSMVGSFVGGQLADQIGRRTVMLVALFGSAAMLCVMSFVREPILFLLGMFLFTCIVDMYRPAASAMIGDLVSVEKRQYSFGLMYVSINLGFAIAPPIGGILTSYSWKWLFWGDALTTGLFGLVILLLIRETRPTQAANDNRERATISKAIRHIGRDYAFLVFCLATFLNSLVFMQSIATLPIAMTGLGMSPALFGFVIAINGVLIVVAQLPLTRLLSRFDRVRVIAIGGLIVATGFGMNMFATSIVGIGFWIIVASIIVWTIGEMFQAPFMQAIVTDLAPVEFRGRYLGVFSMTYASAWALGAPLGGAIMETYGPGVLWKTCFIVGAAGVALYATLVPAIRRRSGSLAIDIPN